MRILLLTHAFNSLAQRLYAELREDGHTLSVEFDIADSVTEEAVDLFRPDVVLAPYLKRAVPASVWRRHLVLIVHPGVVGDRGPSALDWAIHEGAATWGVTVLQAEAEMDAGPVWASAEFAMRAATKSSLYRNEVTEAALIAVRAALARVADWRAGRWAPRRLEEIADAPGGWRPPMRQCDRAIDWARDATATVLARIAAADGFPGVLDRLFEVPCRLFDARPGPPVAAAPGELVARRGGALLRATVDGSVWIGHVRRESWPEDTPGDGGGHRFKLPATLAFAREAAALPEYRDERVTGGEGVGEESDALAWEDDALAYRESADGHVGFLSFAFHNGAMGTAQCRALEAAIRRAARRSTRVLVMDGGADFWSNGIHLNRIEAAALSGQSPADASWDNIQAMNDVCLAVLSVHDKLTIAALRGNAGAGGCFLALAADLVWAREGVVLNPHYRNMGNLHGSEYWTYLLPRRVGAEVARRILHDRLPLLARKASESGLIDDCFGSDPSRFEVEVERRAGELACDPQLPGRLVRKAAQRARDEAEKPLARYREEELARMHRNFYGFDPSFHVARYHFVLKSPQSWTPRHLARHREPGWRVPDEGAVVAGTPPLSGASRPHPSVGGKAFEGASAAPDATRDGETAVGRIPQQPLNPCR